MNVNFTLKSRNAKTGPIPVTTSSHDTCPDACPLKGNGCYAEHGPLGMLWAKISKLSVSKVWDNLCASVTALPIDQLWRHNQAGDLPHKEQRINSAAVAKLVKANAGKRGFTYTHHNMSLGSNARIVAAANRMGFTVNLSGNNLAHADELKALAIAPVVVVLSAEYQRRYTGSGKNFRWLETMEEYRGRVPLSQKTPASNTVSTCPATYSDTITCQSCKLCARQRDVIVGFPAHGTAKRKASTIATAS